MSDRISYRHNPLWDYRANKANRMAFKMADGSERDETKRNALAALRSVAYNDGPEGIDGPLWALQDLCSRDQLKAAFLWFRAAHAFTEDEDMRRVLMIEAYGWIKRALRCYLPSKTGA
jgi:hypothetical protein